MKQSIINAPRKSKTVSLSILGQDLPVPNELFKYIGETQQRWKQGVANQGEAFEHDFAYLISGIMLSGAGKALVKKDIINMMDSMIAGKRLSTVNVVFSKEQAELFLKDLTGVANQQLSDFFKAQFNDQGDFIGYVFIGKPGKVDIDVRGAVSQARLTYVFQPNTKLQKLFNILQDATFSNKNYLIDSIAKGINLGQTRDNRFMSSALSYVGFNNEQIGAIYGKTSNSLDNAVVLNHLRHLRAAYELIGIGQTTGEAKFLVVNSREISGIKLNELGRTKENYQKTKQGKIRVFSNRWLIAQMYELLLQSKAINFNKTGGSLFLY